MSLEREFEEYKAVHKYSVLYAKIYQYYKDLERDKVLVPDFMRVGQRPEDLAQKALINLVCRPDGLKKFNELYEQAYQDLAEVLD